MDIKDELWKLIKELTESQKKTDEQLKKTDMQIGRLTDGWGKFVEGLVTPSIPKLIGQVGITINKSYQRARSRRDGEELEIDILAIGQRIDGSEVVIAVEVKSNLGLKEIKEFEKVLGRFFEFFAEHHGKELIGVVSGIRLTNGAKSYADKAGFYLLGPSGETMVILNKEGFKPRIWKE